MKVSLIQKNVSHVVCANPFSCLHYDDEGISSSEIATNLIKLLKIVLRDLTAVTTLRKPLF